MGDGFAELELDVMRGGRRVFDHVVKQGRGESLGIQVPVGQDAGYSDGMGNIRFAALAELPGVGIPAYVKSVANQLDIRSREVLEVRSEGGEIKRAG